jgi:NAD(P)-dependent dehydrogenase (short-subunit alcohol dehydrogenase family)
MAGWQIEGRTALITGAARGIGAAAAERLHGRGMNVALVGLEPELLEEGAARLGDRAIAIEADVTDLAALERAVDETAKRFGGIDVAIANAGLSFVGALATAPVEHVERTIEVNLLGVWRTNRAVLPRVAERRGYILNNASLTAFIHPPLLGAYATSKAGVEAFTDALRLEMAPGGVAVGCAYFGFLDTDLVRAGFSHPASAEIRKTMPRFVREPAPLEHAVDAIERAVEGRLARVWAPRYVGTVMRIRHLAQRLVESRTRRAPELRRAVELAANPATGPEQDEVLGVAASAKPD